jgi:peptidoglycan/xylan/chitin deacetylase (PgdA/CDA1 family)
MQLIRTYKEFNINETNTVKVRNALRALMLQILVRRRSVSFSGNWIRFPYYHHVFDDERKDFERQLKYLSNYGDFISMNDAYTMLQQEKSLDGRYFCVSFDDGYRCLYDNMLPIAKSLNVPVIIYLPTDFIGLSEHNPDHLPKIKADLPDNPKLLSFLSWSQCCEMLRHDISFGSHTKTHAHLASLSSGLIEEELGVACRHFACPWGRVNVDFNPVITIPITREVGFSSFATTERGKMVSGDDVFQIRRDHLLAGWGNYQLKYFFCK